MFELKRIDPFKELSTLQREMDEFFKRTFSSLAPASLLRKEGEWCPQMDCYMKGNQFTVDVDLPGIDPKDVDISVTGSILTVKGVRKAVVDEKKEGYLFHETSIGLFERSVTLPEGVDTSKIHAICRNGVLELTMPARAEALPRKVTIEIEAGEGKEGKKAA